MIHVGLRVDVDTLRGTRTGVPNLLALLARHHIQASFFFSVGPDNMGRHLWRLMRPAFLAKMLRTGAARLYGWDILLRGFLWPGPVIGRRCPDSIRNTADAGHEVGLHAWDHHRWQTWIGGMDRHAVTAEVQKGYNLLSDILGKPPSCFAAPAWRVTQEALAALDRFPFRYESNCRGLSPFNAVVGGRRLRHVQVPTTLPTFDEVIRLRCTAETYNEYLLNLIRPEGLNVLTVHAEVEGMVCLFLFQDFLQRAAKRGIAFAPLAEITFRTGNIGDSEVHRGTVAGREGWLACQGRNSCSEVRRSC
jgi:undecaprenyl phosphate-alpha-L-ara4FN deformylase